MCIIQRALVVFQWAFQRDFLDLGGRPPLRFLRLACSWLKYSDPLLAISFPPFRPSLTAAGSFFFGKIQRMQLWLPTVLCTTHAGEPNRLSVAFVSPLVRSDQGMERDFRVPHRGGWAT